MQRKIVPTHKYENIRHEIKSGDILLCSGNSVFSSMIQKATNSMWSHVAFVLRLDVIDRIMVLESVESIGVRTVPLSSYIRDYCGSGKGYPGEIMLARHDDVKQERMKDLSKIAVSLLGHPYATQEILNIAARISMGHLGIINQPTPVPTQQFICSEYAYICFKSIGVEIEYDQLGFIAPADFANSEKVKPLHFLEVQHEHEIKKELEFA